MKTRVLIRALLIASAGLCVAVPATAAPYEISPGQERSQPICVLLQSDAIEEAWGAVERLTRAGCDEISVEGAGVLEGRATEDALREIERSQGVRLVLTGPASAGLLASSQPQTRARLERWNARLALPHPEPVPGFEKEIQSLARGGCEVLPPIAVPREMAKTALYREELPRYATYHRAWGAADYQTSEFLLGRVAVAIVTPQTHTQLWSREELLEAQAAARGAMLYWKSQANNSKMPVSLAYEYLDSLASEYSVLTSAGDTRWVSPLMASARARLGIPGKASSGKIPEYSFPDVYEVLNHLRLKLRTDWAVMIIVGHGDRFTEAPGLGAYAYLGGPFLVAPNDPTTWDLTGLLAHESGHLFYALDEYCGAEGNCGGTSSPCTAVSGYLQVPNRNSRNRTSGGCDVSQVSCTMDTPALRSCKYTKAMMGIQDSNADGVFDILETQPLIELFERDGSALKDSTGRRIVTDTIYTLTPEFVGFARETAILNKISASGTGAGLGLDAASDGSAPIVNLAFRPSISMNELTRAEYRVGDGPWIWIRPDTSNYDAPVEDFRFTPLGLSGGSHTIEFRAVNSVGNTTETNSRWRERVTVLAVAFDSLKATSRAEGGLDVTWRVRGKAFESIGRVYRSEDGGPDTLLATIPLEDNAALRLLDTALRPGRRYRYLVETTAFGKTYSATTEAIASVPMHDAEAHISRASPNPFTSETFITFEVPEGRLGLPPRRDGGNKPGPPPIRPPGGAPEQGGSAAEIPSLVHLPVGVSVTIHDVTGRLIRRLVQEALEGKNLYTTRWDGRDEAGRQVPQGIYFARLSAGTFQGSNKITLIR